jgi:hypothetical protein
MLESKIRDSLQHVLLALREPEEFAVHWQKSQVRCPFIVWTALAATAVFGTSVYGSTMGLAGNQPGVFGSAVLLTLAAGLAWGIPLPGLYVLSSMSGSRLDAGSTLLAALVTVSWGALAMLASVPVHWVFEVAIPKPTLLLGVNLVIFTGVGISMLDVFGRVMTALEPQRGPAPTWLLVPVCLIGSELPCAAPPASRHGDCSSCCAMQGSASRSATAVTARGPYRIREFQPGDEHGILELFNSVFAGSEGATPRTLAQWRWEFDGAPTGRRILVAVDAGGRIVAQFAAIEFGAVCAGEDVRVAQGVDSMCDPAWRGLQHQSPFVRLAHAYFSGLDVEGSVHCSYGFPNSQALRVGRGLLGYEPLFPRLPVLFHALREGINGFDAMPPARQTRRVLRFWPDTDLLWRRLRAKLGFALARDARYMNWRYADSPYRYALHEVRGPEGLCAVGVTRPRWCQAPILAIVDYLGDPQDEASLRALLCAAVAEARREGLERVEFVLPERSPLFAQARAAGFAVERSALCLCIRLHDQRQSIAWHREHWYYTIGDSDIF